jgi:hypothetical protein
VDFLTEGMFALLPTTGPAEAAQVIRPMLKICEESPSIYINGQPSIEAIWRTIIDDVDVYGQYPASESTRDEFRS